ncbi:MAG: DedA family protein [Candidatus Kapaibacteriales bacterium]
MSLFWEGVTLFFSCLLAATIVPFSSEALLIGATELGEMSSYYAYFIATAGNVTGCIINYLIGRYAGEKLSKKFGMGQKSIDKWHSRFEKYDKLLWALNWVPIIGDPITIYAGVVRLRFWEFLLWVVPLRAARYILVLLFWEKFV